MIVEVAANPTIEQQGEEAMFNKSTTKFVDVGIQVDLPTHDTSVHLDGNKITYSSSLTGQTVFFKVCKTLNLADMQYHVSFCKIFGRIK